MAAPKKRRNPLINMDREAMDPNYRYTFEKVCIRTERKRKRTIIINLFEIADGILGTRMSTNDNDQKHTERYKKDTVQKTAKHVIQFIQKRFNTQCQFQKAKKVGIISGVYSSDQIQNIIFDYVEEHTMCPKCHYPELTPAIHSPVQCKACGYNNRNKKEYKPRKKKKKKRKKKEKENTDNGMQSPQVERDAIGALNAYLITNETLSASDIMEKIKILRLAHSLERSEEIQMIVYVLMKYEEDNYKLLMDSLKQYKNIFEIYTMSATDSVMFISYLEEVIMRKSIGNNLLNHSYHIFNCLYDDDILDEDEIKEWYHAPHHKYRIISSTEANAIKQKTLRFIEWLENADNEDCDI